MKTERIILVYVCDEHEGEHTQPLTDVPHVGTLICPECGEDMTLQPEVRFTADVSIIAVEILDAEGLPHVVWTEEDITNYTEQAYGKENVEAIGDLVLEMGDWEGAGEAGIQAGWDVIEDAVDAAAHTLGHARID